MITRNPTPRVERGDRAGYRSEEITRTSTASTGSFQAQIIEFPRLGREHALRGLARAKLVDLSEVLAVLADATESPLGAAITIDVGCGSASAHFRRWRP